MNAIHRLAIHRLVLAGSLVSALALATGCPGNEEQPPVAEGTDDIGDTDPPGESTDTGSGTDPGDETVDSTGTDTGEEQCVEEPTEPVELLNGCTDATCEPFANTPERLPRINADGSLPPLP